MSYFINKIKEARQYFTNTLDKITNKSKEKIIFFLDLFLILSKVFVKY